MGCGESKHDVATGNTVLRPKKSNSNGNGNTNTKNSKDIETAPETNTRDNTTNSSLPQQPVQDDGKKDLGGQAAGGDAKDRDENKAVKEADGEKQVDKGKEGGEVEREEATTHDSPNDYFTPRKNEEGTDGVVSGRKSEESEYYSPRHAAGKEDALNENVQADNAVENKGLVEETKPVKENGKVVKAEEKTEVEEAKPVTFDAAKVSIPTSEEKKPNAEEKKVDTPTKNENTK